MGERRNTQSSRHSRSLSGSSDRKSSSRSVSHSYSHSNSNSRDSRDSRRRSYSRSYSRSNSRSYSNSRSNSRSYSNSRSSSRSYSNSRSNSKSFSRSRSTSRSNSHSSSGSYSSSSKNNSQYKRSNVNSSYDESKYSNKKTKFENKKINNNNNSNNVKSKIIDDIEIVEKEDGKKFIKEKPNFETTGILKQDTATGLMYKGVEMKWAEPSDSCKPKEKWILFEFKDNELLESLYLHRQSAYLFGRDERVCDRVLLHPSISKQHAVIQYRKVPLNANDESNFARKVIKPYLLDLDSTNGTFLNDNRIDGGKYIELKHKDVIRFGESTRKYVMMKENAEE